MKHATLTTMLLMALHGPQAWAQAGGDLQAPTDNVSSGGPTPDSSRAPVLRSGFYAPFGFHPGARLSALWAPHARDRQLRGPVEGRRMQLVAGPHLWLATRPGSYTASGFGGDFGIRLLTPRRQRFHELATTATWIARSEIEAVRVDLGTGDQTALRDMHHLVVPALRYVFGRQPQRRTGWYFGGSVGRYFSPQVSGGVYFDLEAGIQFRPGRSSERK